MFNSTVKNVRTVMYAMFRHFQYKQCVMLFVVNKCLLHSLVKIKCVLSFKYIAKYVFNSITNKHSRMEPASERKQYSNEAIAHCIEFIDAGSTVYAASKRFGIPISTIRYRISRQWKKGKAGSRICAIFSRRTETCRSVKQYARSRLSCYA